ncbi:hypothetical protein GCM10010466_36030 [Planomonospora alba]|uniref:Uncharacterized protein n=1 Tax=Planomonospora alba TaxID=161354 RepID=A0ABP6NAK6_9ACTN
MASGSDHCPIHAAERNVAGIQYLVEECRKRLVARAVPVRVVHRWAVALPAAGLLCA